MGRACGMYGEEEKCTVAYEGKHKQKPLGQLQVNGKEILKWTLQTHDGKA
jgi:hypothetical protein